MAFSEERTLYASVGRTGYTNDWLATIDLDTGAANLIDDMGYNAVWGLAFKNNQLYGVSGDGEVLNIDPETAASSTIKDYSISWAGLTISPACLEIVNGICIVPDLDALLHGQD